MHNKLFVFDIETVVDAAAARRLLNLDDSTPDADAVLALEKYHLEQTDGKNGFARQPFHKIIAISFLSADIIKTADGEGFKLQEIRSGGKPDSSEHELVSGLFNFLKNARARLVSYNGRTFDLPVLKYRAMIHGIEASWLYKSGDKWNNYNSRYSLDWHCDLLEAFSDFGASSRIKMNEVCAAFGLPGKIDTSGDDVAKLYSEGKIEEIRDYCEPDVINTYLLYLIYAHHSGLISHGSFSLAKDELEHYLDINGKAHFKKYLNIWQK
jgi:predicted PolB exonuclease-like 3'-5' exonuclease